MPGARPQRPTAQRRGRKVYEYIRVSTAREEMISPELQHQHNLQAAAREGLEIVETVYDLDLSGRDFAKRKVSAMVKGIKESVADGILVWKYSRWGRNLTDSLTNIRDLQDAGGYIVSSTEPGDVETPHGKFSLHMLLVIAELQSDQIKESWLDSQWNRIAQGLPVNGKPRFGYTYDKSERKYTPDPLTAPWLAKAYQHYIQGLPLSKVVAEMTAAGIRGTGGQPLVHTSMLFILDSGFGAGKIVVNARRGRASTGDPVYYEGAHKAVITEEEWNRYLSLRGKRRKARNVNPTSRFSGLMRCGTCGRTLIRYLDENRKAWGCRNTAFNSTMPCAARVSIREGKVEKAVLSWLVDNVEGSGYDEAAALEDRLLRGRISEPQADLLRSEYETELAENRRNQAGVADRAALPPVPTPEMMEALLDLWGREDMEDIVNVALSKAIRTVKVYPVTASTRIRVIPAWESDGDSRQDAWS
jgi:site-specific DNA recombinase